MADNLYFGRAGEKDSNESKSYLICGKSKNSAYKELHNRLNNDSEILQLYEITGLSETESLFLEEKLRIFEEAFDLISQPIKIERVNCPGMVAIVERFGFSDPLKDAYDVGKKYDLNVADMPLVLHYIANYPDVNQTLKKESVDTITGEYQGLRNGSRLFEAWHSLGSLTESSFRRRDFDNFTLIDDNEWAEAGKGKYKGKDVARVHLEDAKKGDVPVPGTPFIIFADLDKDKPNIYKESVSYDKLMADDRAFMIAGSPEGLEALAKRSGKGQSEFFLDNKFDDAGFESKAKGRLVILGTYSHVFEMSDRTFPSPETFFLGASPESAKYKANQNGLRIFRDKKFESVKI